MSTEKSIRVVEFEGESREWRSWKVKFLALAARHNYRDIIDGSTALPDTSIEADNLSEEQVELLDKARSAHATLTLSMSSKTAAGRAVLRLVSNAASIHLPEGDPKIAWDKLIGKYERVTSSIRAATQKKFYGTMMSSKQDPHEYVEYLQEVRSDLERMSVQMSDEQFMMHILDTLPPSYEAVAEVLRDKVNEENTNIDDLTADLMARHSKMKENNKAQWKYKHRKSDELGLAAYGQFKGKCHNCGKRGHKTVDCYQKNENHKKKGANQKSGNGSFNGNCYHCGE